MKFWIMAAVAALGLSSFAQAVEYKIGFVNTERIFKEAKPTQRAYQNLDKEFAGRHQELQKIATQARALQTALDKDAAKSSGKMSEAERRTKERDLMNLNRDFQRLQREIREDFNLRRNEELSVVLEKANTVIRRIAEEEKIDLILQEVVYFSPRIDITDKVLRALDEGR